MEISNITIRKFINEEKLKAIASVTFDNMFVVHDIKIIQGEKGLFLAMPSKKFSDRNYRDIAHPINLKMRDMLENAVLDAYKEKVEEIKNSNIEEI